MFEADTWEVDEKQDSLSEQLFSHDISFLQEIKESLPDNELLCPDGTPSKLKYRQSKQSKRKRQNKVSAEVKPIGQMHSLEVKISQAEAAPPDKLKRKLDLRSNLSLESKKKKRASLLACVGVGADFKFPNDGNEDFLEHAQAKPIKGTKRKTLTVSSSDVPLKTSQRDGAVSKASFVGDSKLSALDSSSGHVFKDEIKISKKPKRSKSLSSLERNTTSVGEKPSSSGLSSDKLHESQKRKKRRLQSDILNDKVENNKAVTNNNPVSTLKAPEKPPVTSSVSADESQIDGSNRRKSLTKFKAKLHRKLEGGQFRWINEQLYTKHSNDARLMFQKNPEMFTLYHKGFESQVQQWPQNPVEIIIKELKQSDPATIVVDFGCGDAKIAQAIPHHKVFSFDLVAVNDRVTACDMARVPLQTGVADVAVFCLSLMGTNILDFLNEAWRVLKPGGLLKIAEVVSRFESMDEFVQKVSHIGFCLSKQVCSNKMFVLLDFRKIVPSSSRGDKADAIKLKPCIYKRR